MKLIDITNSYFSMVLKIISMYEKEVLGTSTRTDFINQEKLSILHFLTDRVRHVLDLICSEISIFL